MAEPKKIEGDELEWYHRRAKSWPLHIEQQAKRRLRAVMGSMRDDAVAAAGDASTLRAARDRALTAVETKAFSRAIAAGARRTDSILRGKIGAAGAPPSSVIIDEYARRVSEIAKAAIDAAWVRALQAGRDEVAHAVDAEAGKLFNRFSVGFASFFFSLNSQMQRHLGIRQYVWLTRRDNRVRSPNGETENYGFHTPLEGAVCNWDAPPLTADKSTSGKPCHAGQDIDCRCVAWPYIGQ